MFCVEHGRQKVACIRELCRAAKLCWVKNHADAQALLSVLAGPGARCWLLGVSASYCV